MNLLPVAAQLPVTQIQNMVNGITPVVYLVGGLFATLLPTLFMP